MITQLNIPPRTLSRSFTQRPPIPLSLASSALGAIDNHLPTIYLELRVQPPGAQTLQRLKGHELRYRTQDLVAVGGTSFRCTIYITSKFTMNSCGVVLLTVCKKNKKIKKPTHTGLRFSNDAALCPPKRFLPRGPHARQCISSLRWAAGLSAWHCRRNPSEPGSFCQPVDFIGTCSCTPLLAK